MSHIFQHMADMGAALALLVAHHRCMLALGNASILVGFFNLVSLRHFLMDQKKIPRFEKLWMFSVPRLAREVATFAQDVKWLVDMARDACRTPPKPPDPS